MKAGDRERVVAAAAAAAAVVAAAATEEEDRGGKRTKCWGDVQFNLFLSGVGVQVEFYMRRTSIIPVW